MLIPKTKRAPTFVEALFFRIAAGKTNIIFLLLIATYPNLLDSEAEQGPFLLKPAWAH